MPPYTPIFPTKFFTYPSKNLANRSLSKMLRSLGKYLSESNHAAPRHQAVTNDMTNGEPSCFKSPRSTSNYHVKELPHVHIKLCAMTRAMTFWHGVIWKWDCILIRMRLYTDVKYVYVLIMQFYVMLFTALHAQARACTKSYLRALNQYIWPP